MRSFDLFDTLLGRFHYLPDSIFHLVEREYPFPGFAFYRKAAEYQSERTLEDIYRKFRQLTEISEERASQLMEFEFQTELGQVFPIVENGNLVQDGDLIITDTYYSEPQIEKILEKIGLNRRVRICASPAGKSSGRVWDAVKKGPPLSSHLGDNLRSDVAMPRSRGIEAHPYEKSRWSRRETEMGKLGEYGLACLMRALRLQNPYVPESPEYLIWNEQGQLNIPVLIHASLYLDRFCREHGKKRILFTARDGCLWVRLFQAMYPRYDSIYFHASRYVYMYPTPSFIEYARGIYTDDSVIVDSHGKGRTCEAFFGLHLQKKPAYLAIVNSGRKHHAIVRKRRIHEGIEKMNYDLVGALYDVRGGAPVRCKPEYDLRFVAPGHLCMEKCLEILSRFNWEKFDQRVVKRGVEAMEGQLTLDNWVDHSFFHGHVDRQNGEVAHIHQLRSGSWHMTELLE